MTTQPQLRFSTERPTRHVIAVREIATGLESETSVAGVPRDVIDLLIARAHEIADPRRFVVEELQGFGPRTL